jgi:hypothetical protein
VGPSIIILEADDVIFPEIFAILDFNENQRQHPRIFEAVAGTRGHIGGLVTA